MLRAVQKLQGMKDIFLTKHWFQNKLSYSLSGVRYKSYPGQTSSPGHGAGRGGGAGGTVRESGGGLGEYGAAQEEHYFFNKKKELLEQLKKNLDKDKQKDPKKGVK